MSDKRKPYAKNVEGDFYVEDGCCITCMVPEVYAPDLMGFDEAGAHCFIARQPTDDDEVFQAIKATWAAELQCIRYGGENPQILRRLAEAGAAESCDRRQLIKNIRPLLRNHVTFDCSEISSELEIATQFRAYLLAQNSEYLHCKATEITRDKKGITFAFSWYQDDYYSIWFERAASPNAWHIFHSPDKEKISSRAVSLMIDERLTSNKAITNIKWLTSATWNKSFEWQRTPL